MNIYALPTYSDGHTCPAEDHGADPTFNMLTKTDMIPLDEFTTFAALDRPDRHYSLVRDSLHVTPLWFSVRWLVNPPEFWAIVAFARVDVNGGVDSGRIRIPRRVIRRLVLNGHFET